MATALTERPQIDPALVEQVLIRGDLRQLTPAQKVSYYNAVCQSLGLNPLTQPFAYITLNGKEVLYAKRDAAEQLRRVHDISIDSKAFSREVIEGCYVVTAPASMPSGRTDVSTGVVPIEGLKGEARANAMMKAETKAKRRVTLSICGLGMLDETEVETLPRGPQYTVDASTPTPAVALPEGSVQIVRLMPKTYGGDVVVVDATGVEAVYPVPDTQCAALCEQIAQEGVPVTLSLVTGKRDGRVKVKAVKRWIAPAFTAEEERQIEAQSGAAITADEIPF